jgi:non-canonical purine NTP pyrophosphatase (RdgB/HAM1 family)
MTTTSWVLVTSNESKWAEAQRIVGHPLERLVLELPELQADTTTEVAIHKARAAFAAVSRPVIVEDAGLELAALGGFPGPFIKFWEKLGGLGSICLAANGLKDRRAEAVCVLALCNADGVQVVEGRVAGTIASEPRGNNGFGWDAVFVPEGEQRTWGQMSPEEKDARSHRRRAWELLATRRFV